MPTWRCVQHCGACCHLEPDDRPDLDQYLTPPELELYLSLVGEGGWCIHYDHSTRHCRIYADRPRFCRVQADVFQDLYGIEASEVNDFAIDCCQEQIAGVYGHESPEMDRFDTAIQSLEKS
ncbi:zinc/iron-chelating domain-containing protein [Leptolyngbya sp. 'hensonii']|uniref:YkgJ family cysteine cluster protein n=1 Tax=Leptolyngbya sp. 'hensonii' TaxID=1922337 RepID=UPI0009500229|nr:YkgJ family cysteine cluster protein [Leptolyngbya sp. 'hensonii']OLP17216.1 zinc/iron-chelating domain-containing protein [Leptolyngbya sp. 'hensonii']